MTDNRVERSRVSDHEDDLDRSEVRPAGGTPKLLVQVYDGGAKPTSNEKWFLTHPVLLSGTEAEGSSGTFSAESTSVPVVVIGSQVPAVGDVLNAFMVGSKWVAEKGVASTPKLSCGACAIPEKNLTLSWTDGVSSGTATMVWNGINEWQSVCAGVGNSNIFLLLCNAGVIEFRVIYFISGVCPSGQSQYCSTLGNNPLKLNMTSLTCGDSFLLTATVTATSCPQISDLYTDFSISV